MVEAFKDCHGAFIVNKLWENMDVKHEMVMLRTLREVENKSGVKHFVFYILDKKGIFELSIEQGYWKLFSGYKELGMYVPHYYGKWEVHKKYEDQLPVTALYT